MNSRRNFIRQSLAVSAGFMGLSNFVTQPIFAAERAMKPAIDRWLELPEGFHAKIISRGGEKMSDGFLLPGKPDGMAAFQVGGKVVLVRNHENSPTLPKYGAFGEDMSLFSKVKKDQLFDFGFGKTPGLGGTTTVIFDEDKQEIKEQFLSLAGTYRNCAGGPTPWNSWITCEEDTSPKSTTAETNHGYNFEVPASSKKLVRPVPLKAMGRFNHEAICVDPSTCIVYQTEDAHDSLIYRFIPARHRKLHEGGILQALAIKGRKSFDSRNWTEASMKPGEIFEVEWITMNGVDSDIDDLRLRGHAAGATLFARGEGMWFGNKEVYFACTNGGLKKSGQVFKYIPSPNEGTADEQNTPGKLVLFAEPNNTEILKNCDNLTVSPWGDVIFVEDAKQACLRGITPEGQIYDIGKNIGSESELAGVCFSPSGKTLFVNVQHDGLTLAITGAWDQLRKMKS
jgi:uncharacterized protein